MDKESRAMFDQALDMLGTAQLLLMQARAAEEARDAVIHSVDVKNVPRPDTKGGFAVGDRIQHKRYGHLGQNWHGKVIRLRPPKGLSDYDITVQWDKGVGSEKDGFPAHTDQIEHENPKQNKAVQYSAVASADCRYWSKL